MKGKRHDPVETCKTALIVLLSVSAVVLLCFSPLVQSSGLRDVFSKGLTDSAASSAEPQTIPVAAVPVRMAVGIDAGLYGVQYDQTAVDALFSQTAALLGEALAGADKPAAISESDWRTLLAGEFIYFGYTEPIPLPVLCQWLSGGDGPDKLDGSAARILLAPQKDGTLALCYQSGESFYRCATTLDAALHLDPILDSTAPNGSLFAFENQALSGTVAPYVLFTGGDTRAPSYTASAVSLTDDTRTQLLTSLRFSAQNQATVSGGSIFVDGDETIWLYNDGRVRYYASGSGRYSAGEGLTGAVAAAWPLVDGALSPLCGEARLCLTSAEESAPGLYTVTFGYLLNGSAVYLYDQGWAAQVQVQSGAVTDFTLYPRSYSAGDEDSLLLPADKAADALAGLSDSPRELVIQYRDSGTGSAVPGWVGR